MAPAVSVFHPLLGFPPDCMREDPDNQRMARVKTAGLAALALDRIAELGGYMVQGAPPH